MRHPLRYVLLVLALLYALSLDHGLPNRYVPDDHAVRCALGMAQDFSEQGLSGLVPESGRYTIYPYLLPYLDLALVGGVYVGGRATGAWGGTGEFREAVFDDPTYAWLPARMLSALLALLVPWGLYRSARELRRSRGEAALAALLGGSSLVLVLYAHTSRPWAAMLGLMCLTQALSLRAMRKGSPRSLGLASLAAGLSASAFTLGLAAFAFPFVAWVTLLLRGRRALLWRALPALGAGLLVAALVGYPYMWMHGLESGSGVQYSGGQGTAPMEGATPDVEVGGLAFIPQFGVDGLPAKASAWFGSEPALLLLGLPGLFLLARRRERRLDALLLAVAPALCFMLLFLFYELGLVRYLMPATALLGLPAAAMSSALARRGGAARVVALLLLALPLVQAARLDQLLGRQDTRTLAVEQLVAQLPEQARVAVDGMGSLYAPPIPAHPEALLELGAAMLEAPEVLWLNRREQRVLQLHDAGVAPPANARRQIPVSRFWRFDSYYPSDYLLGASTELGDFFDAWRVDHYIQVDRLPDEARRAPITELMAARGELIAEVSPTGDSAPAVAELPTDMQFALTQLWAYERPGPWVRLWRLKPAAESQR
ncbi:MAG: hypothetical protein DHS20C15_21480 [Planctomycetota bacterium]|nr:MAG: hypothetical protein DHS20C15_21480 [Planctomycetota bacterium]